jgi:GH18 family chitinase
VKEMASRNGLKVILEFGNSEEVYSMSGKSFSKVASTFESRKEFIAKLLTLVEDYQFDGLSLKWDKPGCHNVSLHPLIMGIYSV